VQIGGVFGGFKIGYSNQGLPMKVRVHALEIPNEEMRKAVVTAFEERVFLIFTGKQVSIISEIFFLPEANFILSFSVWRKTH
jgi:hypothetical protein